MTQEELTKANNLLSERQRYQSWLNTKISHCIVTMYAPRSGPGNDRDSIEVEIPKEIAIAFFEEKIKSIERFLKEINIEI